MKGEILWKEWVGLVAGGKVLGVASAARGVGRSSVEEGGKGEHDGGIIGGDKKDGADWVGDAKVYAQWLGKGVGVMAERLSAMAKGGEGKDRADAGWKCLRSLFWRSFGLGANYWGMLCTSLLLQHTPVLFITKFVSLIYASVPHWG